MPDPIDFKLPPGVVKVESKGAAAGRWISCDRVRWVRGLPQKIGGYDRLTNTALLGTPRGMLGWSDGTARQLIATGTERRLYVVPLVDYVPVNITPFKDTVTDANPLSTSIGSALVNVYFPNHNANVGDGVKIEGASAFNNVTIDGDYLVTAVVDVDNFTITAATAANANGSGGGATVTMSIEISTGYADPEYLFGYGVGVYGSGGYGEAAETSSYLAQHRQWSLQAFGRILLASYNGGTIYDWDPLVEPAPRAQAIAGAPEIVSGHIVTAERTVMAWGTETGGARDLLEVRTSRQGVYTDWDFTGLPDENGSPPTRSRLAPGKEVVGGAILGGFTNILWTDASCHTKQYTGSKNVYQTTLRGTECGLLGPMAFAVFNGRAYWVSKNAFFMFDGAVKPIPNSSDIAEWIFGQLRENYTGKCFASVLPRFSEVWFFFVVGDDTEPSLYAVYHIDGQYWFHGNLQRTSIALLAGQSSPVMASEDGYLYEHETGVNADGLSIPWSLESGLFELKSYWTDVLEIEMDMQRHVGDISFEIEAYDGKHVNSVPIASDTKVATPNDASIYPRISGRQVAITISGSGVGSDFRLGVPRIHYERGAGR